MKMFPYYKGWKVRPIKPGELEAVKAAVEKIKARRLVRISKRS